MRITYDPADPTDMTLVDIDEDSDLGLAFFAWAVVVVAGARFARQAYRRRPLGTPPE